MRLARPRPLGCNSFRRSVMWLLFLCVSLGVLPSCRTVGITGRKQFVPIPEAQLNQMGLQGYQQILQEAKVSANPQYNAMVTGVGKRIAAVADRWLEKEGREPFEWEFTVVDADDQVNAFALPGGKVAFYTGILPVCEDETGVAVVMGHEVAHAFALHGGERVSREAVSKFGLQAVMLALGGEGASQTSQLAMAALGVGYQYGVALPFSRGNESEADQIGLHFMAEAGYDPSEAADFWGRMEKLSSGGAPPEFLSTHPSHDTRVEQINAWLPEVLPKYEASKRQR